MVEYLCNAPEDKHRFESSIMSSRESIHSVKTVEEGLAHTTVEKDNARDSTSEIKLVEWEGNDNDKEDMKRISTARKYAIVLFLTSAALQVTSLSSAWSTIALSIEEHFHASHEVVVLGISLYVFALAAGPLFTAPLSEAFGRKPVFIAGYIGYIAFQFLTAFAPNIGAMVAGRFLAPFFGSVFMANTGGTIADIFDRKDLGVPMAIFTAGPFIGPGLGPVIAGFIDVSVDFRWTFYVFIMWSGVNLLVLLLIPETYPHSLLVKKAKRLRKETGDESYKAAREVEALGFWSMLGHHCTKPFAIFFLDPIMTLLCFYTGFGLAIVYFFFVAFPTVFREVYGFSTQFVGLTFLGFTVGMIISMCTYPLWEMKRQKDIAANGGIPEPEMRMPQMALGAVLLPVSLFWFAWTIYPSIHWMCPLVASAVFGVACFWLFNGIISYTIESYKTIAASAMAANVCVRCLMAGTFPLFGDQMLNGMGFHWAISLIAFISVLLLPSPFLFLKYGKVLRAKSKYASA
ncbi:probable drug/proton antiporter Yhk8p [Trichomonascus vanleenenianus]|uniref:MFS transporter n=1 Tax=Trichomonascus vanleenenianus TaxID=2268995 RepID=UPI003EC9D2E2